MLSSEPQFVTCRPFESPDGPPVDVGFTTFFSLKQGLTIQPRLAWNSLRRPGYSQTHRDPTAPASGELGLNGITTQQITKTDTETQSQTLDGTFGVLWKSSGKN